jgi:hypothetical protein
LAQRSSEGSLSDVDVRSWVERVGQTEFDEIRMVLDQDGFLLPPIDEHGVYVEFVAVYLELRFFAANLLPIYFPALRDTASMDRLLDGVVDGAAIFARTRLAGAPEPVLRTDTRSDESHDYFWRLNRSAQRALETGNTVRAAILRTRAARVAPAALTAATRRDAKADVQRLTQRLQAALQLSETQAADWLSVLPALLDRADQGTWPVEAALLYDLQKVGVDHEREIYALDAVEWFFSGGKRPIKRPLPGQRLIRIAKHLHTAAQRLTRARLSDDERRQLGDLLQTALAHSEDRLRSRFRPVLTDAFIDVGLGPANPPEQTAFAKMIEELLDRIGDLGFLTFSDLRDALSRNQLKMPDVADPQTFVRGDPLIRLDRRLAVALDGVYRPSEFYLRWLERLTAPGFGTPFGRRATWFVTLPFGGALLLLEALQLVLEHSGLAVPIFGPLTSLLPAKRAQGSHPLVGLACFMIVGFFLMGLLHWPPLGRTLRQLGHACYRVCRLVLFDLPLQALRLPWVQRAWKSWPAQLSYAYIVKPLAVCGLLWLIAKPLFATPLVAGSTFIIINFVVNSRVGRAAGDMVLAAIVHAYELLRAGLIPGLFRLVIAVFKNIIDGVEYVLFAVDDWLRFRTGDSQWSMVLRTVAGLAWYPVAFLARFYMLVLIEPGFNPVKAPVSYLAAKVMGPLLIPLAEQLQGRLQPAVGAVLAYVVAVPTAWLLPDAVGFLTWEMKENWKLYRANRRPWLAPVPVGPHAETIHHLLHPGFHSGTVPRLFTRLRRAERVALQTGNWRSARACRDRLRQVEKSLQRLVARELVTLLEQSPSWQGGKLSGGSVSLATNRLRLDLLHSDYPGQAMSFEFDEQADWLVARVGSPGWLDRLTEAQRHALALALAGLYKLAGIDLVYEQLRAQLPAELTGFELTVHGLRLWLDQRHDQGFVYDLRQPVDKLQPKTLQGVPAAGPALDAAKLVFARVPLPWSQWVENWQKDQDGRLPLQTVSAADNLLPLVHSVGQAGVVQVEVPPP